MSGKPLIIGLGGTLRAGSATETALAAALRHAEQLGAETRLFGGDFLRRLPVFDPDPAWQVTEAQAEFADAIRGADGLIVASPGYHGGLSGMVKNALDTLELTRSDARPYLTGRAVGAIVTADGWQAAGTTLMSLRATIHALRGWPTPFGAALNATSGLFDPDGEAREAKDAWQIATVAEQVMEFASMRVAR